MSYASFRSINGNNPSLTFFFLLSFLFSLLDFNFALEKPPVLLIAANKSFLPASPELFSATGALGGGGGGGIDADSGGGGGGIEAGGGGGGIAAKTNTKSFKFQKNIIVNFVIKLH